MPPPPRRDRDVERSLQELGRAVQGVHERLGADDPQWGSDEHVDLVLTELDVAGLPTREQQLERLELVTDTLRRVV